MPLLIIGQGLAGTTLAWELLWRGCDFRIIDEAAPVTSSRIAGGLITPITGQRLALGWRVQEMWDAATAFYSRAAATLGHQPFSEIPVVRLFREEREAELWSRKGLQPEFQPWLHPSPPGPLVSPAIHAPHGGFQMRGARLDTRLFLDSSRDHFLSLGLFQQARFDPAAPVPPDTRVIFCEGHAGSTNPHFPWFKFKSAKGEILTLHIPDLDEDRILSSGLWLLPLGGGHFRAGSTYDWDHLDTVPTAAARATLEEKLRHLLRVPFTVIDHHAAVRPIIRESRAVTGLHPARENLGFFNGLGSKGSLHAPWFARDFASHLIDHTPLDPGSDLRKN